MVDTWDRDHAEAHPPGKCPTDCLFDVPVHCNDDGSCAKCGDPMGNRCFQNDTGLWYVCRPCYKDMTGEDDEGFTDAEIQAAKKIKENSDEQKAIRD